MKRAALIAVEALALVGGIGAIGVGIVVLNAILIGL